MTETHTEPTATPSAATGDPLLEVRGLSVSFRQHGRRFDALSDVDLTVMPGETLGVVGESGAGKSTLGRAVLGLVAPSAGTIRFDGHDITGAGRRQRLALASRLQVVFQDPFSSLNPARPVRTALAEPLRAQRRPHAEIAARTTEMLARVGLPAEAADRYPRSFSGGQLQRIAIARALMVEPDLVICDEALSALDLSIQAQIINLLLELKRDLGLAYLFIGHDLAVIRHLADRVLVLQDGCVVETGTAAQVCTAPAQEYTRRLMEAAPLPDPRTERERLAARARRMREPAR